MVREPVPKVGKGSDLAVGCSWPTSSNPGLDHQPLRTVEQESGDGGKRTDDDADEVREGDTRARGGMHEGAEEEVDEACNDGNDVCERDGRCERDSRDLDAASSLQQVQHDLGKVLRKRRPPDRYDQDEALNNQKCCYRSKDRFAQSKR
jgi:hypothetical protein